MIDRRTSLTSFLILLFFGEFIALSSDAPATEPMNVLFIGVDDLRPELNCYGANHMLTPNIDRLAAEGIRFNHAYCQQAVCLPSRISLFTGMRPDSTGVHDLNTKFRKTIPDAVTLPQHFGKSGYHTIGMGKVYHDEQPSEWDKWIETKELAGVSEYHLDDIVAELEKLEAEATAKNLKRKALRQYVKGPSTESADRPDTDFEDGAITQVAIKELSESQDRPFFMTVGFHKPHLPLIAPSKYWNQYDRNQIDLPDNYFLPIGSPRLALSTWGELRAYNDIPKDGPVSDEKAKEIIHGYRACVSFVDAQIGLLMDSLKTQGLDQNTIVVLWSDHGWKLGEHAMWCKHTNFEIDARVPLIIRMPGAINSGRTSDAMVELVDLFPTLCELTGTSIPKQCEGASLAPILRGEPASNWRKHALSQFKRSRKTGGDIVGYSIKNSDGRYTEWINQQTGKKQAIEYYDHHKDPAENKNTYDELSDSDAKSLSEKLRQAL